MILINCVGGFRGSQKKGEGGGEGDSGMAKMRIDCPLALYGGKREEKKTPQIFPFEIA